MGEPRAKRRTDVFIAGIVVFQVLLPLRYYLSRDTFDERFAWRMFSPVRVIDCHATWTVGPDRAPLDVDQHVHDVWRQLVERARMDVVRGLGRFLCDRLTTEGRRPQIRVDLECAHPDGQTIHPISPDLDLCAEGG